MKYFKFRRGTVIHFERKSDKHRTWTVCGKVRLTHILIEVEEAVLDNNIDLACGPCLLGMTKRAFESYKNEAFRKIIMNSPEFQKKMIEDIMRNFK